VKNTELFRLANKTAIVTGGGSGIGRRVGIALAENGVNVAIGDMDRAAANRVVSEIEAKGHQGIAIKVDVTHPEDVHQMVDVVVRRYGRIDILFNNAGIGIRGPAERFSLEDWNRTIAVNLTGMFICAQAVGNVMMKQGGGKIINTSSVSGKLGHPGNVAYAAAKHGLVGMSKVMAVEWAKHHINVNCIGPGLIRTPLTAPSFKNRKRYDELVRQIPMGRFGEPEDLVGAVIFLASDASNYMTGQTIYVEGGRMID
jgi:NAD(P)-dependent dehydrogenase (short-subunit alcohol dehydrogenase family)